MPIIKTISASCSRKFYAQQTGSAEYAVSLTADLLDGEDPEEETRKLLEQARDLVKTQIMPFVSRSTAKLSEVFHFLPEELQQEILNSVDRAKEQR